MSDKQRQRQVFQTFKQKYVGLGTEDTMKEDWLSNVRKDTYTNIQGHSAMLEYVTIATDGMTSKKDMRMSLLKKMVDTEEKN
ncbi:hypothetical protein KAFR_0J02290 [Kazachstania africana CBS 2517]|uniref:Splicing factor subunit n=1 Tax=Kazachstania africana (strain ATCC 22294 / BCRC 22015 / CBS 2517 / CECT 1963 / NBRC 1671 / NRRL Y-8276) TaxID=1071382 RepID=H2B0Z3_KAZAF|nr:hypothetical protein KAFR_0J02290 [Kazachstania africana CBS 2517]CCF60293.1 hypothetical protein KAFR_0J02290 [Kazachstania africana CBS 2517]